MKTAQEMYPYLDNENNNEAIRVHNQRMHDKRDAYNDCLKALDESPAPIQQEGVDLIHSTQCLPILNKDAAENIKSTPPASSIGNGEEIYSAEWAVKYDTDFLIPFVMYLTGYTEEQGRRQYANWIFNIKK